MSEPAATEIVFEIEWTESERGWGQRPDGFTYHKTEADAQKYVDAYWKTMPNEVPDCYSRPGPIAGVIVNRVFSLLVQGKGVVYSDKRVVS